MLNKSNERLFQSRLLHSERAKTCLCVGAICLLAVTAFSNVSIAKNIGVAQSDKEVPGLIAEISGSDFERLVSKSKKPVLVDFYATWCMPCRKLAPEIANLAKNYSNKMSFYRIDVDKNPAIASRFRVESIPALKIFRDGVVVEESIGLRTKKDIESLIKRDANVGQ